jgi:large subunit ribosomal protein L22
MDYQATAKYIRTSTRKMRLIADAVRPLSPVAALVALSHMPKLAARPLLNVFSSAVANAKQKGVAGEALSTKRIEIMGGPSMKRWHAVSRGQAHSYKKRMTHIRVVLTDESMKALASPRGGEK